MVFDHHAPKPDGFIGSLRSMIDHLMNVDAVGAIGIGYAGLAEVCEVMCRTERIWMMALWSTAL